MRSMLILAAAAFVLLAAVPTDFLGDVAVGVAAAAPAEEGAAASPGPIPSVTQGLAPAITALIVFGIVLFILGTQVWPTIQGGLEQRADKIREEIAAAEAARAQAKSALEEYERSLSQARAESQKMLDETKAKQAELAAELRSKADRELTQMRDKAMRDIEAARRGALNEIYEESVAIATMMASKILQREVTADDRERLIEESLAELGGTRSS